MRLPLLAALALVAAPVLAQDAVTLRPGHPDLQTAGLSLDTETIGVRATGDRARDLGTLTTTARRDGDTVTLETDADVQEAGMVSQTTVTFAWPSLAPATRTYTAGSVTGTTTYDGAHVTGTWKRGDWDPIPFDITLRAPAFQPEVLPVVARSLPFREGYVATVPTFGSESRLREPTLTVVGPEDYTRADGSTVAVWVVEQSGGGNALRGNPDRRHYVDAETRALVASTFTARGSTEIVSEPVTEAALAALEAEAATPTVEIRPGLERLETQMLTSGAQDYVIRVVEPVQQDAGTITRTAEVDAAAGTVTITTVQDISAAGQRIEQTATAAYPSLEPISSTTDLNGTIVEVAYGDGTATVTSGDQTQEVALDGPVFDSAFLFDLVRLLPYEEGYRGEFYVLAPGQGVAAIPVSVGAPTEVDGQTVWPVTTEGGPGTAFTFLVDPETHDFVRIEQEPQVGVLIYVEPAE